MLEGRREARLFADGRYGGARRALAKAVRYRDTILKRRPSRSPVGTGGVHEAINGGIRYFVAVATRSFSVSRHGRARARRLAILTRARLLRAVQGNAPRRGRGREMGRAQHNILRIDRNYFHGWMVKLTVEGSLVQKHFSDGRFGGSRRALAKAARYRDAILKRGPARSHVGTVGVHETVSGGIRSFVATVSRSFSVNRYGVMGARRQAILARAKLLGALRRSSPR